MTRDLGNGKNIFGNRLDTWGTASVFEKRLCYFEKA